MVMLELLKVTDHSGTMLGLLIHWPGSRWLSGAMLPGTLGLAPLTLVPQGWCLLDDLLVPVPDVDGAVGAIGDMPSAQ